ncbi:hypothetical protein FQV27_03240 [Paracoccus aurantiacus]|uniref:VTT domain-containing protein n=1 Tax=Paracoccus aurantiacus TaxID=2599412 RepID=A0A5C6S8U0_9RHOB|nr:VTT domain-containing protein [Paracoccus aurantiacus]TXB70876.1 hypothetical protein FQV27_03240 [Paracoccus aurantiacus]
MTQELLRLLPSWGPWLLAISAFLSCMMVPVPTSLLLISAGALSGTGHDFLSLAAAGAIGGAFLGDLTAFSLSRRLSPRFAGRGARFATVMRKAREFMARRGLMAIFLSRWLVTPLGPPTNYVAGASGVALPGFAAASLGGEVIWAALHLGIGHVFGRQFRNSDAAEIKALAAVACAMTLFLLARWLWRRMHRPTI